MKTPEKICANCKFIHYNSEFKFGECRKDTPYIGEEGEYNMFPVITLYAWCGEYQIHQKFLFKEGD